MLLIFKERVCTLGTDFTDITFLSKYKQAAAYCFQYFQKGCVRFGTDFTDIAVRRFKNNGVHLAFTIFRRGVSVSAQTSRTLSFEGQKNWGISLSEFGLASNI